MIKKIVSIMLLISITNLNSKILKNTITYEHHGGRLGDRLISFIKCCYLAEKYSLHLVHRTFPFSDEFKLHKNQKTIESFNINRIVKIQSENHLKSLIESNKIRKNTSMDFVCETRYFTSLNNMPTKTIKDRENFSYGMYEYSISHPDFHKKICNQLSPIHQYTPVYVPEDHISIAVHVRKGVGYDLSLRSKQLFKKPKTIVPYKPPRTGYSDYGFPLKFPPDQYYIDQIIKLSELLGDPPILVHIFTDHPTPLSILRQYKRVIKKPNIIYSCRQEGNHYTKHVVEDLCNMAFGFDFLISSTSSFAWIAKYIGNHKAVIEPLDAVWHEDLLIINAIELVIPNKPNNQVHKYQFDVLPQQELTNLITSTLSN